MVTKIVVTRWLPRKPSADPLKSFGCNTHAREAVSTCHTEMGGQGSAVGGVTLKLG